MNGAHRAPAIPRAARGRHRAKTAEQLLGQYRWWAIGVIMVTVYVLLVVPVEYYGHGFRDPWFVYPNIGVLLLWWGLITMMLWTWNRLAAARQRERERRWAAGAPAQVKWAGVPIPTGAA